jgi:hypothetical protein
VACGKGRGEVAVGLLEQPGRFAGPALRGDGDTEVMRGQADLGVVGTEHRLEDPERTQAEGFGLCLVILVAGQYGQVCARHGHLEMIWTISGLEDHQRFPVGSQGLIEAPGLVIQGAKRVQVPPRVGVIVSHCFDAQGQTLLRVRGARLESPWTGDGMVSTRCRGGVRVGGLAMCDGS